MKPPFQTILCPTDASPAGDWAASLAYMLVAGGGTVHLLHVSEPPFLGNPMYAQYAAGYVPSPEDQKKGEERVKKQMHALKAKDADARGVRTEIHVVQGVNVANVIVDEAKRLKASAIVLGTHGRTGLGRLVFGSVATAVLGKGPSVPVILARAPAAAKK
jgi:nucleotide-binding universal stress UspA family protein